MFRGLEGQNQSILRAAAPRREPSGTGPHALRTFRGEKAARSRREFRSTGSPAPRFAGGRGGPSATSRFRAGRVDRLFAHVFSTTQSRYSRKPRVTGIPMISGTS